MLRLSDEIKIPCFLRSKRIQNLIESDQEISQEQVYQELLRDNSDSKLHEMSEDEILNLILKVIFHLRKKIDKEIKLIYI